jgi:hypothetical protein
VRRSFASYKPVSAEPYPAEVRAAISQLIADYAPVELRDVDAHQKHPGDPIRITGTLPNGETVHRVLYDEVTV